MISIGYRRKLCDLINIKRNDIFGYNVYLRYTTNGQETFPLTEDLHLGRICCQTTLLSVTSFLGINRCDKTGGIGK